VRARRDRRAGRTPRPYRAFSRVTVARVCVVAVALLASAALRGHIHNADYVVAVGVFFVVALVGPLLHARLIAPAGPGNAEAARVSRAVEGN
jgi:hypothetical protein